jgi:hypothetical protein
MLDHYPFQLPTFMATFLGTLIAAWQRPGPSAHLYPAFSPYPAALIHSAYRMSLLYLSQVIPFAHNDLYVIYHTVGFA